MTEKQSEDLPGLTPLTQKRDVSAASECKAVSKAKAQTQPTVLLASLPWGCHVSHQSGGLFLSVAGGQEREPHQPSKHRHTQSGQGQRVKAANHGAARGRGKLASLAPHTSVREKKLSPFQVYRLRYKIVVLLFDPAGIERQA